MAAWILRSTPQTEKRLYAMGISRFFILWPSLTDEPRHFTLTASTATAPEYRASDASSQTLTWRNKCFSVVCGIYLSSVHAQHVARVEAELVALRIVLCRPS